MGAGGWTHASVTATVSTRPTGDFSRALRSPRGPHPPRTIPQKEEQ